MTGAEDVIRQLVARLGDAADFHFAPKYVDCIVEEYVGKLATLERGTCKPTTYDNYFAKRLKPGEYYEFWEPACACSECGELIPMRRFCPNCGARIEVDE